MLIFKYTYYFFYLLFYYQFTYKRNEYLIKENKLKTVYEYKLFNKLFCSEKKTFKERILIFVYRLDYLVIGKSFNYYNYKTVAYFGGFIFVDPR